MTKSSQAVQGLWIRFRDANGQFHADKDSGSIASINAASGMLQMPIQRAQELENSAQP
ncbi:lysozyme inhibitor LprI family protein [Lampropedia aestuarii]|uniref:lysozyme inhibitor LprI family protein n=1 Tax=Lampropedia aestuarii TaxID=2562762 RepID=UPI001455E879|nr:lysozyme inhibitor LprI family protein [Lampropedia aestuarii]